MITDRQLSILHHTLGLRPDRREPWRNHYLAGPGHHSQSDLDLLVRAGLMQRRTPPLFCAEGDVLFTCTEKGKALAVELLPPEPKRTKYQDYLQSESAEGFAWHLGINVPKYESRIRDKQIEWRMYRILRRGYWERDIQGDWEKTKKAAKASYKCELKKASAQKRIKS